MAASRQRRRSNLQWFGSVIFVTVGSMIPFNRLVQHVDGIAATWPDLRFHAQIGAGDYSPRHMTFERLISPAAFMRVIADCKLVVAHAGMGSIISAAEANKPIVILPRRPELGEVASSHQIATARRFGDREGVWVAEDVDDLERAILLALESGAQAVTPTSENATHFARELRALLTRGGS